MKWWTYWALREASAALPARWVRWALAVAVVLLLLALLAVLVPWGWERLGTGYAESATLALGAGALALWLSLPAHWRNLLAAMALFVLAALAMILLVIKIAGG